MAAPLAVGTDVGAAVGNDVGAATGNDVGAAIGKGVGAGVGADVGAGVKARGVRTHHCVARRCKRRETKQLMLALMWVLVLALV